MAVCKSVLLKWYNAKSEMNKCVDFLNEIIPDGSINIKSTSQRVEDRFRYQFYKISEEVKMLSFKGSKAKRVEILNKISKISTLVTGERCYYCGRLQDMKSKEREIQELPERLNNLNNKNGNLEI